MGKDSTTVRFKPTFRRNVLWNDFPMFVFLKVRDGATLILSKIGISQQPEDNQQDVPGESKYNGGSLCPQKEYKTKCTNRQYHLRLILFDGNDTRGL